MESSPIENPDVLPHDHNDAVPHLSDSNGGEESEHKFSAHEVQGVLETIASTGKFWHDWEELKSMISFHLKQVLSEYPESKIGDDQQKSSLGESYAELVKRLEDALFCFTEGPPFTLQRLCEILLNARCIYPNLSKLALAVEKNLLVTTTLAKSTDPYPSSTMQLSDAPEQHLEDAQPQPQAQPQPPSSAVENGEEPATGDKDVIMSEADNKVNDGMTTEMETFEEMSTPSEANPEPTSNSESSTEHMG